MKLYLSSVVLCLFRDVASALLIQKTTLSTFSRSSTKRFSGPPTPVDSTIAVSKSSSTSRPFEKFNYNARWYPVVWARDLLPREPTKVTVFDVDYVVAKLDDAKVVALEDRCPHKGAALSEGRVTGAGNIMCSYHGWTFDTTTTPGACVDIPQLATVNFTSTATFPKRSCAKAVPSQIHQEMVYLFIGGTFEESLVATPPPSVEEYDTSDFKMSCSIRDMPVDWPIVVSNICDAEHGAFAHQAKSFDMYTASKDYPLQVVQDFPNDGKDWIVRTKVDSTTKVLEVDRQRRLENGEKVKTKKKVNAETPWATTIFEAPFHLQMRRLDKKSNSTAFVSAFYICPVGVGRCRFMAAGLSKMAPPRFLTKLLLDNFLDQDTYLLATQQHHILSAEANELRDMIKTRERKQKIIVGTNATDEDEAPLYMQSMSTRRNLFCLCTPNDAFAAKLEQFWDSTLLRSPNRIANLMKLDSAGAFLETASREIVLDRKSQHLDICLDSQSAARNCRRVRAMGLFLSLALLATKRVLPTLAKFSVARRLDIILRPTLVGALTCMSLAVSAIANKAYQEYFFKYTDIYRRKDLRKIPRTIWMDV